MHEPTIEQAAILAEARSKPFIYIPLTQGLEAKIDLEDLERVSKHKWFAHRNRNLWYAEAKIDGITIKLHRFVLNFGPSDPEVDHENQLSLDCTKANLRPANDFLQAQNKGIYANNKSGVSGVYKQVTTRGRKYWHAQITRDGRQKLIGRFLTKEEAVEARFQAERDYADTYA